MATKNTKSLDRHRSQFMTRLPEAIHAQLLKLKAKTGRTMSREVLVAVEAHLESHGLWPPDKEPPREQG